MHDYLKKSLPAGAALLMTLGTSSLMFVPTALADTNSQPESSQPKLAAKQAEQIAMNMFSIPSTYTLQNESYNKNNINAQPASYNLNYSTSQNGNQPGGSSIQVNVNANTGTVLGYYHNSNNNRFVFPVPVNATKAKTIADQWAQKLFPKQFTQVKSQSLRPTYGNLSGPVNYTFDYERVVNGIPAPFDGFRIVISQNGHLASVQDHWTNLSFPSAKKALSAAAANTTYQKSLHLQLEYQNDFQNNQKPKTELIYQQSTRQYPNYWGQQFSNQNMIQFPVIDATTGNIVDASGSVYNQKSATAPQPLVPNGPTWGNHPQQVNWTQQQSLQYAQKVLDIPSSYKLQSVNQINNPQSDSIWNFSWKDSGSSGEQIHASVDATYGFISSYNSFTPAQALQEKLQAAGKLPTKTKLTQQQIDANVKAFVKRLYPNNTGGIGLVPQQNPNQSGLTTSYQLVSFSNGIVNMTRSGNVSVNPTTGKVQNLYTSNQHVSQTLPSPSQAISAASASAKWMAARPLKLEYLETQPEMAAKVRGKVQTNTSPKILLAYAPIATNTSTGQFNAVTGEFSNTGTKTPYTGTINDIKGLKAAPQIQLLVHRELLPVDNNGDVHPNQAMTHSAFIKLLVDALGYSGRIHPQVLNSTAAANALSSVSKTSPASQQIRAAYSNGWLPANQPFQPNAITTRDWAAQVLARALNMNALLSHPSAFTFHPNDNAAIPSNDRAGDALAVTLGLMSLNNGNFNPTSPMTVASSAVAAVQSAVLLSSQGRPYPVGPIMG